ncbi:pinopsin-like protein [Sarcoptes scabiei]|nr:pinopsin-like protein [Sarcoptes scabiei]
MWPEENWNSWNKVFKLIFLSFVSTIGSLGSIFIISAITVIDTFQVRSNCYLVSLAFGHLLMTILVLPASALIIIADIKEETSICHFQWLITLSCFIVSVLSYLCLSIDNLFSLKSTTNYHLCCSRWRIFLILLLMWFAAFFLPFIQHTNRFGPEFCSDKRDWKIASGFHLWILGALILSTIITLSSFIYSLFVYKTYKTNLETLAEATILISTEGFLIQSNTIVYVISLLMWLPMSIMMVINSINPMPQNYLDTVWCIAIANSCCFSYLYALTNRDFRDAFNKLFYYCCCKSHVTFSRKSAIVRRPIANESMNLRVHIIPGLNIYSPRKETTTAHHSNNRAGGGGGGGHGGSGNFGHSMSISHNKPYEL